MSIFLKLFGSHKDVSNAEMVNNSKQQLPAIHKEVDNAIDYKEITIKRFFRTELYNPAKYIPLAYNSSETGGGNMKYNVAIDDPELGVFNRMEIIVFQSTSVANVILIADSGSVTNELRLFIDFLVKKNGADDHGKKELSREELEYLQLGFGATRYWVNHGISVDLNVDASGEFEISFYGIKIDCDQF